MDRVEERIKKIDPNKIYGHTDVIEPSDLTPEELEAEIARLKKESDALTDWPLC